MKLKTWHEIQDILPPLTEYEFEQLKASIEQDGIKVPILVLPDGRIIDGHHRWMAANELDIEPTYQIESCTETQARALAIILNIARRQLSYEQLKPIHNYLNRNRQERRQVARELRNQGRTQAETAAAVGVAQTTIVGWESDKNRSNISSDITSKPPDVRVKLKKSDRQVIYNLYRDGLTQKQIAARYKVSQRTIGNVVAKIQAEIDKEQEIEELRQQAQVAQAEHWRLICGDFAKPDFDSWLLPENSIDAIITDPPYGQKYLSLYRDLAKHAAYLLRPHGMLLAMCGQSYLPDIFKLMSSHLTYRWTVAYLTPGGQSPQIWPRRINTFWKPVLIFVKNSLDGDDWHGDVIKSDVNDNDKRFHEWGQSESGMARLVESFTQEGDLILDPFCGGGTTGIVSLALGRRFVGIDNNSDQIAITRGRISEARG